MMQQFEKALEDIREAYCRPSSARRRRSPGAAMFESRLRSYEQCLKAIGLLPLRGRRILDLGCRTGKWLDICCARWGADESSCFGVDLDDRDFGLWQAEHPDSRITLLATPAHELPFPDGDFDVAHHSMMFTSIPDPELRTATARRMWRVLKPAGILLWYDFWINPLNPRTVPLRLAHIRRLFPEGHILFHKTISLAPPICRVLRRVPDTILLTLENIRLFNTHILAAVRKPG